MKVMILAVGEAPVPVDRVSSRRASGKADDRNANSNAGQMFERHQARPSLPGT